MLKTKDLAYWTALVYLEIITNTNDCKRKWWKMEMELIFSNILEIENLI